MPAKQIVTNDIINDHIISLLNLEALPDEQRIGLIGQMVDVVNQRLLLRMLHEIDPAKKSEFNDLLDKGSDQELNQFVERNFPDFLDMIAEETIQLKEEMVKHVKGQ